MNCLVKLTVQIYQLTKPIRLYYPSVEYYSRMVGPMLSSHFVFQQPAVWNQFTFEFDLQISIDVRFLTSFSVL